MECEEENFYKLIAFLVDVCPKVVCNYFKRNILCGDTFASYLKRKKHILFHLNCNKKCCECVSEVLQQKHISNNHFKSLFDEDKNKRVHRGKNCICIYVAKKNINPYVVLDISLANCMLKNCEKVDNEIDHWLTTLINTRNKIVHSTDTKSINELDFNYYWKNIEGAVFGLAKAIDDEYEQTVVANVEYLRRRQMLSDDKLKECQLLHDWWRDKCCDFEKTLDESRSQLTTVCETTKAINENECRHHSEINEKIDSLGSKIDILTEMQSRSNTDFSHKDSSTDDTQSLTEYVEKKTTKPVFVKNEWNDDVKIFWLRNRCRIRELKGLIQIEIGIHPDNQELVFEGTNLTDDRTISYYGISHKIVNLKQKEQQTIPLLPNVIQELARGNQTEELVGLKFIYVRTKKNKFIEIDIKNCMTIFDIKELIFEKEGIPYYKQVLYNGTVILDDGQLIKNCGIKEGQSLVMFYYLRYPGPVTQSQLCSKEQAIERNKRKSSDQMTSGMNAEGSKIAKNS
ncbi:uncharacterized protein [Mytilus edulis]|uniref:uncharacterized protein isoform X1 n=1 Tax=Mytilus edulis TaxID=6550 RepID=UPI0039F052B8